MSISSNHQAYSAMQICIFCFIHPYIKCQELMQLDCQTIANLTQHENLHKICTQR